MSGSITTTTGSTTATSAGSSGTRLSADLNTFLRLLTTQWDKRTQLQRKLRLQRLRRRQPGPSLRQ